MCVFVCLFVCFLVCVCLFHFLLQVNIYYCYKCMYTCTPFLLSLSAACCSILLPITYALPSCIPPPPSPPHLSLRLFLLHFVCSHLFHLCFFHLLLLLFCHQPCIGMNLPELVTPVLVCFEDQDPRVRYYACESLYNISKVARGAVLVFFNNIFDGLCKVINGSNSQPDDCYL